MWQGVLPADPYLLRVVEAGTEHLVARPRLHTRQRLSVVCGGIPCRSRRGIMTKLRLLLLEDVLECRPLRERADAEARIGSVVHSLQHEARVEHVQRVLERLGLVG